MQSMTSLFQPRAIAVVGASQRRGRGSNVIVNLREGGFKGGIYAVNPRYDEVFGSKCYASVTDLPRDVDCIVVAVGADSVCDILEQAYEHGIRAAVVLAAGFGEGGYEQARVARLQAIADAGMCICGPNCMGFINLSMNVTAFSGHIPWPLRAGSVALVSQSGGLGIGVFSPLMADRELGFAYFVSCGNQIGATIEDYVEYFLGDESVNTVVIMAEALINPQKLTSLAAKANSQRKSIILFQAGRTAAGQALTRSHTGALAGNSEITAAFLHRCGIVQVDTFEELVETIELFAVAGDATIGEDVIVLSGSGGGAAIAADVLSQHDIPLSPLQQSTRERIQAVMPDFGSITNPIDGTGMIYDDPTLLPKLFDALLSEPGRPVLAASVLARPVGNMNQRRLAETIASAARSSGRTFVGYQYSSLGGPLDPEILKILHSAGVPFLLGTSTAMISLKNLLRRREYWARAALASSEHEPRDPAAISGPVIAAGPCGFLEARQSLTAYGIPVTEADIARTEAEAVALLKRFGTAVAVKAEAPGLLHKSDVGCVRLGCKSEQEVIQAFNEVINNARAAGIKGDVQVLVQPMVSGVAEAYAGIIDDPQFGPAICFGLGGVFVEIFKDATTEMAPLSRDDALHMIHRIRAAPILTGARGRKPGDVAALADLLVGLGQFAVANRGRFRALDLNPIIVKPAGEGVVAVDIAVEPVSPT